MQRLSLCQTLLSNHRLDRREGIKLKKQFDCLPDLKSMQVARVNSQSFGISNSTAKTTLRSSCKPKSLKSIIIHKMRLKYKS